MKKSTIGWILALIVLLLLLVFCGHYVIAANEPINVDTKTHKVSTPTTIDWLGITMLNLPIPSSSGTVTNFSAGDLSPLFTTTEATTTTTPALSFVLSSAGANTWFGNATGSSAAPVYNSSGALTKTDDTNVTLTLGGTPATALLKSASITVGWTGTLAASRGGTGGTAGAEPPLGNPGTNGFVLSSTTSGTRSWVAQSGGGTGSPGGSPTQVQFNDSGAFGGDAGLVYDKAADALTLGGKLTIGGPFVPGSGDLSVQPGAAIINDGGSIRFDSAGMKVGVFYGASVGLRFVPVCSVQWSGTSGNPLGAADLSIGRGSAGVAAITDGSGSYRDLVLRDLTSNGNIVSTGTYRTGGGTGSNVAFGWNSNSGFWFDGSGNTYWGNAGTNYPIQIDPANNLFRLASSTLIGFTDVAQAPWNPVNTALARNASGVLEINNGTLGTYRDLNLRNLTASGTITGNGSIPAGGTTGQQLTKNSNTNYDVGWAAAGSGGGSPGGSPTQVQYNNSGAFGGITNTSTDGTTLTLTSPKIITGINASAGPTLLGFTPITSAVNYVTVTNSIAGSSPIVGAAGTDTNIDLYLAPKGTGGVLIDSVGSSNSNPRIWGVTNIGTFGTAARCQFGDYANCFQINNNGRLQITSWYGTVVYGARTTPSALAYEAGTSGDASLNVVGTNAPNPVLQVTGASGQSTNFTEWKTNGGTVLSSVTSTGAFSGPGSVPTAGTTSQILSKNSGSNYDYSWVSGAALTKTDDTNVTLTLGGTPATALLQAASLTLGWTGTLSQTRGGFGANVSSVAAGTVYANNSISSGPPAFVTNPRVTAMPNLSSNGFVKTSGGTGTLSVDTNSYALAGSGWDGQVQVASADFTSTASALTAITGLQSSTLAISTKYLFTVDLYVNSSDANGMNVGIDGAGGLLTSCVFNGSGTGNGASVVVALGQTARNAATANFLTQASDGYVQLRGIVTTSGSGSPAIIVKIGKVTAGTAKVYIGSILRWKAL